MRSVTHISGLDNLMIGEPAGTRTQDPVIKSHVLYRLSYGLGARSIAQKRGDLLDCSAAGCVPDEKGCHADR